jgi:undecaprenyl-diphosphatase
VVGGSDPRPPGEPAVSLTSLLRWIGEHVRGFHAAVGLFLTIGLVLAVGAAILFAFVAALVAGGATARFDQAVLLWFSRQSGPRMDALALEITALGAGSVTTVVLVVASLFLWQTRHRYSAALLWIAVAGGWVLNAALKAGFDRPRPDLFEWRVPYAGMSSYPSGHAMTAMVLYATLAYLIIRLEPTRALRRLTLVVFGTVIALVGVSRLYLGVHYPSDVIGGFLVGFGWATFCALGIEAIRYFRDRRPGLAREERDLDRSVLPSGTEVGREAPRAGAPAARRG